MGTGYGGRTICLGGVGVPEDYTSETDICGDSKSRRVLRRPGTLGVRRVRSRRRLQRR